MDELKKEARSEGKVHWLDYVLVLLKHGRLLTYPTLAVMALTYMALFLSHDMYTSSASLLPPHQNMTLGAQLMELIGGGITPGNINHSMTGDLGSFLGLKSPGELYVGLMYSDTITNHIIDRFNLRQEYHAKTFELAGKTLRKRVEIKTDKDGLIKIKVKALDPKQAAEMANAYVDELDKLLKVMRVEEAGDRLGFLEKQRQQTRFNVQKAEEALRKFGEHKSVLQIDAQVKSMLEYIAKLRASIDAKEIQIDVLQKQATLYNYDVIALQTELKGLKVKLKEAETQWDQSGNGEVCLPTSTVPSLQLEFLQLTREVKFQEALYQLYAKLVEFARMDIARNVTVIQTVDRAEPPGDRSNQRMAPTVLIGAAAFFLMAFIAFVWEYFEALKSEEEEAHRLSMLSDYLQSYRNSLDGLKHRLKLR